MDKSRCRLCLNSIQENRFVILEEFQTNMLKILVPEVDLGMSTEPKLCDECAKLLVVCYEFKTIWLENIGKERKVSLPNETGSVSSKKSCCLCGEHILEELGSKDLKELKKMADKCVPELNIYASDDATACKKCVDNLTSVNTFLDKVVAVEASVKTYFSKFIKGEPVNLHDVFQFFYASDNGEKARQEKLKLNVADHKKELTSRMTTRSQDVINQKDKNTSNSQKQVGKKFKKVMKLQCNKLPSKTHGKNNPEYVPVINEVALDQDKVLPVAVPWIPPDDDEISVPDQGKSIVAEPTTKKEKSRTKKGDTGIKNSERRIGRRGNPKLFYCDQCSYTAKWKSSLVSHLMRHKTPSETKMFRCEECGHETKRKADLRFHMIIHKDPAEVKQFKCPQCPYTSKRNGDLKLHLLVHSTKPLYKCEFCPYETAHKMYFMNVHSLMHKDKSDVPLHKCPKCPYETKIKYWLNRHLRMHRSTAELELFKCNWCQFQTRHKHCLREHLITHKDPNQMQLFECYTCGYKGKRKKDLKSHLQSHLAVRGEWIHCDICPFKTQLKSSYRNHLKAHKNISEMLTCGACGYETKTKYSLISHMRIHMKKIKREEDGEVHFNIIQIPLVSVVKKEEIVDEGEENG